MLIACILSLIDTAKELLESTLYNLLNGMYV